MSECSEPGPKKGGNVRVILPSSSCPWRPRNGSFGTPSHVSKKVKLATKVEGDPKAPFSIATTPRCRGALLLPWIAPLYPWSAPYNAECYARRHQVPFFESLVWLDLGLNPGLPGHWRTLYPLGQCPVRPWNLVSNMLWVTTPVI